MFHIYVETHPIGAAAVSGLAGFGYGARVSGSLYGGFVSGSAAAVTGAVSYSVINAVGMYIISKNDDE